MIEIASRFISAGLVPLMIALALDVEVVCVAAVDDGRLGIGAALVVLVAFTGLWFAFPIGRSRRCRRAPTASRAGA